jgi:proteasome alpha subunit
VLGGEAEAIAESLGAVWDGSADLRTALQAATAALAGPDRTLVADDLEVAVLTRTAARRAFRRVEGTELDGLLGSA